ncbi:putative amine oxidase [Xylogone sp. PMI_703]|nr:putative amine oxidase [Xylogone sp. PMI_703]
MSLPNPPTAAVDVVIVGAGLAGLQAARGLQSKGISCVVLEARDRVGGKTWSKPVDGGESATESGAAWINNTTQPKIYELSQKFGLDTIIQYIEGREVITDTSGRTLKFPFGEIPFTEEEASILGQVFQAVEETAQKVDIYDPQKNSWLTDVPLSNWLSDNGLKDGMVKDSVTTLVRALLGVEPEEISALYFLDYIKSGLGLESLMSDGPSGAQYMRIRQGQQKISIGLATDLKPGTVHLNIPVQKIQQFGKDRCIVTAGDKQFAAKKVIVSIPTPLYKTIVFDPPLPIEKQELVDSLFLGDYSKFTLVYKEPWWRRLNYSGSFANFRGPVSFSRDTSSDVDGQYSLTLFVIGEHSRVWSRLSSAARKNAILEQVADMTRPEGLEYVYDTVDTRETIWMQQPWSNGAPCPVPGPGVWGRLGNSLRSVHDNIHFIGTETAFEWKGYMEGAIASGVRGASEVVEELKPQSVL